jgi:hypothetical protein
MNNHINLAVAGSKDGTQPVEVRPISPHVYEVLYSPGFVEGIAAGDVIRVTDYALGQFKVEQYGGNVSIKIADSETIVKVLPKIDDILSCPYGSVA